MSTSPPIPDLSWEASMELLDKLPSLPVEERAAAVERLVRSASPGIRERALRMGAAILSEEKLVAYLRNDADAVMRNAGLEILKLRGNRSLLTAVSLLRDEDDDVALQAVLVLDHLEDLRALEPLRGVLNHRDPNVIQAAIIAIGHLGDARAIPDLLPFLDQDPWLQMAAVQALGDLRSPTAVPTLTGLLTDLMVGGLAAEALARIGGPKAFRVLAEHWLRFRHELDDETMLGLLAHVAEGLPKAPAEVEGLREALAAHLASEGSPLQVMAARSLLALGPGGDDRQALRVLAGAEPEYSVLPGCLCNRPDLVADLLAEQGTLRAWGFLLLARNPKAVPVAALRAALREPAGPELLDPVTRALSRIRHPELPAALLDFYLNLAEEYRGALGTLLALHRPALRTALAERHELPADTRLVLSILLGETPRRVATEIAALGHRDRIAVLSQIAEEEAVLRELPWERWVDEEPALYGALAAEVAVKYGLRGLLPVLRRELASNPSAELVRTMGELGDRESIPQLLTLLGDPAAKLVPVVLESLGRIGGPEARRALRETAASGEPGAARIAYKALSVCATEEDDAFFRDALAHPDWYVRLACAEVLGRFSRPENLAALAQLAADPVAIVSQRALSFLES